MSIPLSLNTAARQILLREISSVELVRDCLDRIRQIDGKIRAWVVVDEEGALATARALDDDWKRLRHHGALHGIPVAIKDVVDVVGLPTKAGSPLRAGHCATSDAPVVVSLRAAGAVILGKTVTCEFACFDPSPTRNPWSFAHTPGGSSSGSAAAIASGMCLGAVGTQTGGSVIRPAAYCGIAGYKPTRDAVSRVGVVPVSEHLDHVGFFGRRVEDLAAFLSAAMPAVAPPFDLQASAAPRLGVLGGMFDDQADDEMRGLTGAAVARLEDAGAHVVRLAPPQGLPDVLRHYRTIMAYEAAAYHRPTFTTNRAAYGRNITTMLDEGLTTPAEEYQAALDHQRHFVSEIYPLFEGFAALVTPATPTTAPARLDTTGDPSFNAIWSYAGVPAVCVPCGIDKQGMPAALQLVGPREGDWPLLTAAAWCEQQLGFDAVPPIPS